jgi:quercetin dioxygenase-like cupin family protein
MGIHASTDEPETFSAGGNTFRLVDDGTTTEGRIGIVECTIDPGWPGPPQHVHREHDETFYVLSGRVRFASGADSFVAEEGRLVTVPIGVPHTFGNADADAPAVLLCSVSPSRYVDFFRELATLPTGDDGRVDVTELRRLMRAYATQPAVVA